MLRTRSGPNSASIPCVTPIEPPISAMSSPMRKMSSSSRIARRERVADGLAVGDLRHRRSSGRLRASGRCRSSRTRATRRRSPCTSASSASNSSSASSSFARSSSIGSCSRASACSSFDAVDLRVADVVAVHADGDDVHEDGPLAGAGVLERLPGLLVDLLDVLAVDLDRLHVVGERALATCPPTPASAACRGSTPPSGCSRRRRRRARSRAARG